MSDLDELLDNKKFFKRAFETIDEEEFNLMNEREKADIMIDIFKTWNKVINYLGYERRQDEKGIWHVVKNTPSEEKEIEEHEKWLDEYYEEQYNKYYKDKM